MKFRAKPALTSPTLAEGLRLLPRTQRWRPRSPDTGKKTFKHSSSRRRKTEGATPPHPIHVLFWTKNPDMTVVTRQNHTTGMLRSSSNPAPSLRCAAQLLLRSHLTRRCQRCSHESRSGWLIPSENVGDQEGRVSGPLPSNLCNLPKFHSYIPSASSAVLPVAGTSRTVYRPHCPSTC